MVIISKRASYSFAACLKSRSHEVPHAHRPGTTSLRMQLNEAVASAAMAGAMSSLYPDMRFSWEIKSVDALFCNGMTRVGDLSREAILASLRESDLSVLKDEVNKNLFNDKKFCKECITVCVKYTRKLEIIEELIDFLYSTSEETR